MDEHPPISIAIIGAGIAGITLAIALSEHNPSLQLTIYESRLRFSEISAGFLAKLVELIPKKVKVCFGKRIIDVAVDEDDESAKLRVRFEDQTDTIVDGVIGCDGIRSACRRILLGDEEPASTAVYSGKYAYRKVVDMKKAIQAIGNEVENRQMYLGHGGHLLTFPIRGGKALNMVAFKDADKARWTQRQWVVPSSREAILKDFAGFGEKPHKLLEANPEKWALFDTLPAPTYAKDAFCILGDAAHATTPHLGAGAGFAIEDVHLLSGLLTPELIKSPADLKYAFRVFDETRRPRCRDLIAKSRKQGQLLDLQKKGGGEITEDELRRCVTINQKWVWEVDLSGMLERAKVLMKSCKEAKQVY
ncbi:putative salicylate hydroxylase [Tricladium varicosporioides]|nr:putative salicylate hydroxylase [Hymenoscyphus varicosporioides]